MSRGLYVNNGFSTSAIAAYDHQSNDQKKILGGLSK